jgi:hypothetical protein
MIIINLLIKNYFYFMFNFINDYYFNNYHHENNFNDYY